jgi:urea transport system permease protein
LRATIEDEIDPALKARKARLERLLTLSFGADLGLDLRGALNPLLATTRIVAAGDAPAGTNIADELTLGRDQTQPDVYDMRVAADLAPARLTGAAQKAVLAADIADGKVGGRSPWPICAINPRVIAPIPRWKRPARCPPPPNQTKLPPPPRTAF